MDLLWGLALYFLVPIVAIFLIACVLSIFFDPPEPRDPSWFQRRDW
jgi:hypothetical protein